MTSLKQMRLRKRYRGKAQYLFSTFADDDAVEKYFEFFRCIFCFSEGASYI